MLPDFLIVGAGKSGTGSLSYILNQSSEIHRSEQKELMFFNKADFKIGSNFILEYPEKYKQFHGDENKEELIELYEKHFRDALEDQKAFEITPSYMGSEKGSKRIPEMIEDMKVKSMMRH